MREALRVLVLGTGQMGSGIARLVFSKPGLALVGVYARRRERAGVDAGHIVGLGHDIGLPVSADLAALLDEARPDVAIQATSSRVDDARDEIETLLGRGVRVITIAEQMAFPAAQSPAEAARMDRLAVANQTALVGTGVNPGFVLDLLIVALTGLCSEVVSISATRVNDLSSYGPSVLKSQGVGLGEAQFREGVKDGTITGHYGFAESIHMIANALGWEIDDIRESREPIVSRVRRETRFVVVEPGQVAGCLHGAVGRRGKVPVITLDHPQQIQPQLENVATGDRIEIVGTPAVRLSGCPEIPGGPATIALAVNMIPRVLNAPPGLHSMVDLPVPSAMMADVRTLLDRRRQYHAER